VVVYADPSVHDALRVGVEVRLDLDGEHEFFEIIDSTPHNRGIRLKLSRIDTRDQATALKGQAVMVDRQDLPELGADEYYDFELVGNSVVTTDGKELGVITEVVPTGANDVYVVIGESGEILVPATRGAVLSIDRDSGRVTVEETALEYSGSSRSMK